MFCLGKARPEAKRYKPVRNNDSDAPAVRCTTLPCFVSAPRKRIRLRAIPVATLLCSDPLHIPLHRGSGPYAQEPLPTYKNWRRGSGSNRRIKVLQTSPLPLGYRALEPRNLLPVAGAGGTD